jgi:hypothetical protein
MSRTLQFKRYDSATLANTVGANGELIINTTNHTLTVHNGVTSGGYALLNTATDNNIDSFARSTANSKLSLTGGTVTGNLVVTNSITSSNVISGNTMTANNLTVTGNFSVDGVAIQWHTPIPFTSKGDVGDKAGLIAIDNDKLYRCVEDYTNGANNIWRFINFTGGTWG